MWRTFVCTVGCLALTATAAWADDWNKKTVLTVGETIQVPGAILEPGKYVIKLRDSLSNRHIVSILNEREDHVFTTILAIPNYRLNPTANTEFAWWEVPAGNPRALRAWFYPGDNFGQEFAYPKGLAVKIAQQTHQPVPSVEAAKVEELPMAPVKIVEETGVEKPLNWEAYRPPEPAPVETQELAEETEAAPQAAPAVEPVPAALPKTASPFPLLGLGGALALLAGMGLRLYNGR